MELVLLWIIERFQTGSHISPKNFITSANIVINCLFLDYNFIASVTKMTISVSICSWSCIYSDEWMSKIVKNNIPEITDLLRYWTVILPESIRVLDCRRLKLNCIKCLRVAEWLNSQKQLYKNFNYNFTYFISLSIVILWLPLLSSLLSHRCAKTLMLPTNQCSQGIKTKLGILAHHDKMQ